MTLNPRVTGEWVRIVRDLVIIFVAAFMLIYETIIVHEPNVYVLGTGLTLLGIPPALRLDAIVRAPEAPRAPREP